MRNIMKSISNMPSFDGIVNIAKIVLVTILAYFAFIHNTNAQADQTITASNIDSLISAQKAHLDYIKQELTDYKLQLQELQHKQAIDNVIAENERVNRISKPITVDTTIKPVLNEQLRTLKMQEFQIQLAQSQAYKYKTITEDVFRKEYTKEFYIPSKRNKTASKVAAGLMISGAVIGLVGIAVHRSGYNRPYLDNQQRRVLRNVGMGMGIGAAAGIGFTAALVYPIWGISHALHKYRWQKEHIQF
jgi:hypothetical protein